MSKERISKTISLSRRSVEILDRWSKIHGSEGRVIDMALRLFNAKFEAARLNKDRQEKAKIMNYIIKQGLGVLMANGCWGADSPMVFLDRKTAEDYLSNSQKNGFGRGATIEEWDQPYEAYQLAGFRSACKAVKDYNCEINQQGELILHPVNGSPEIHYINDWPQVWRVDATCNETRLLEQREILYQFETNTPIARWLRLLYGVDLKDIGAL